MQEAVSLNQNFHHLPIREVRQDDGQILLIAVPLLDREVSRKSGSCTSAGSISTCSIPTWPENSPEDRLITAELYGGDLEMRMRQEIVLGDRRRERAQRARDRRGSLSHERRPFGLPRARAHPRSRRGEGRLDFYAALQLVASANVFTTHTPVPAGNDAFPREMMLRYFGDFADAARHFVRRTFPFRPDRGSIRCDPFSMTILALRASRHANGVSKLHGEVSRRSGKMSGPACPTHEVPITSITNGIHTKTWMAPEFSALYTKYLGDWEEHLTEPDFWRGVIDIPDAQLWETHQKLKLRLVDFVRERVRARRERSGESPEVDPQRQSHSRSGNSHDRFRASFRHLQTRRAFVQRPGAARSVC